LAFLDRFMDPTEWQKTTVADQLAAEPGCGRLVAWLIVTAQVTVRGVGVPQERWTSEAGSQVGPAERMLSWQSQEDHSRRSTGLRPLTV
jgi:hypothetical protein